MKNFNSRSSHSHHGSKRHELVQHTNSHGLQALTHTYIKTVTTTLCQAPAQLLQNLESNFILKVPEKESKPLTRRKPLIAYISIAKYKLLATILSQRSYLPCPWAIVWPYVFEVGIRTLPRQTKTSWRSYVHGDGNQTLTLQHWWEARLAKSARAASDPLSYRPPHISISCIKILYMLLFLSFLPEPAASMLHVALIWPSRLTGR